MKQGRGEDIEVLIIHALPQLNKTGVECVLYTIDENETVTIIESTLATLTVQGWSHIFRNFYYYRSCGKLAIASYMIINFFGLHRFLELYLCMYK